MQDITAQMTQTKNSAVTFFAKFLQHRERTAFLSLFLPSASAPATPYLTQASPTQNLVETDSFERKQASAATDSTPTYPPLTSACEHAGLEQHSPAASQADHSTNCGQASDSEQPVENSGNWHKSPIFDLNVISMIFDMAAHPAAGTPQLMRPGVYVCPPCELEERTEARMTAQPKEEEKNIIPKQLQRRPPSHALGSSQLGLLPARTQTRQRLPPPPPPAACSLSLSLGQTRGSQRRSMSVGSLRVR